MRKKRFLLGVGAGIAAYKSVGLLRDLIRDGHDVSVVPTPRALHFVGKATWEALSQHSVICDPFEGGADVAHVEYVRHIDAIIIAPATADLIAQLACGLTETLLTASVLTSRVPVFVCPAMHTAMYEHPATQRNLDTLRRFGYHLIDPVSGALSSGDTGVGRLAPAEAIIKTVYESLDVNRRNLASVTSLSNMKVTISAGGTREAIDAVRFIANASSGKQGIALAQVACERGANVTLVGANISQHLVRTLPSAIRYCSVVDAKEMEKQMVKRSADSDIIVMAAAVADVRVRHSVKHKLAKDTLPLRLELEPTPDILAGLCAHRHRDQLIVGFAAQTGTDDDVLKLARKKVIQKGADMLVVNNVSNCQVFGQDTNTITMLDSSGKILSQAQGSKYEVSHAIWDAIYTMKNARGTV